MIALHAAAPTPDAVKLIVALHMASLEYETVKVDAASYAQWEPPHSTLAPQGQLPVLVDGDYAMPEAALALQYIGEAYAPALVPRDPWLWYDLQALNQRKGHVPAIDAVALQNIAVRDAAGFYPHQNLARTGLRHRDLLNSERRGWARLVQNGGAQIISPGQASACQTMTGYPFPPFHGPTIEPGRIQFLSEGAR